MAESVSRRRFVAGLGATLAATQLSACGGHEGNGRNPTTVAVVGAGLAGLAAAGRLRDAGVPVRVFEQSQRPGGRAWTLREGFGEGVWVDAGAMTAGESYSNWLALCDAYGIEVESRTGAQPRRETLLLLQDDLYRSSALTEDPTSWPLELSEREKALAPFVLLAAELRPIAEEIGSVERVLDPDFAKYDNMSLLEFLLDRGLSPAAITMVERPLNYNSLGTVSALSALRDMVRQMGDRGPALAPVDGHGALPEAMADDLGDVITYGSRLVSVRHRADGVALTLEESAGRQIFEADYVILTVPFTALRKVAFEPALPAERQYMIDRLPYTQIAKTFLATRTRFWSEAGEFGALYTDTPFERVFNLSERMPGDRGMLLNWVNGVGLQRFDEMDAGAHAEAVVDWLVTIWPRAAGQIESAQTVNWAHSYAEGAYAHFAPGQLLTFAPEIPKPVGRVHFAGEHTELVAPGLEGAVTSGLRAAVEVLSAAR